MDVNNQTVVLRCIPDRLINRVIVTAILDRVRNLDRFETQSRVFSDILPRFFRIENRNQGNANETFGIVAAKFMKPSVVRAKDRPLKRALSETVEKSPDAGK